MHLERPWIRGFPDSTRAALVVLTFHHSLKYINVSFFLQFVDYFQIRTRGIVSLCSDPEGFICTITRTMGSPYKMKGKNRTISPRDWKKRMLLKYINNSPGIRYRELLRATGFPNGVMAYHLKILEKSKQMKVSRQYRKITRYYPLKTTAKESRIIEFMKRPTDRRIILFILQHDRCQFNDIELYIKRASSTVSWHLSRLREAGIISMRRQTYRLNNRTLVISLTNKIKQ